MASPPSGWKRTVTTTPRAREYFYELDGDGGHTGKTSWERPPTPEPARLRPEPAVKDSFKAKRAAGQMVHIFSGLRTREDSLAKMAKAREVTCFEFDTKNGPCVDRIQTRAAEPTAPAESAAHSNPVVAGTRMCYIPVTVIGSYTPSAQR